MAGKGENTRRRIIEKSLQLFSVKGYYHTSVSDILEATGLTKGGLYGHFPSKEEIWYAVYDEAVEIWKQIVFERIRGEAGNDPMKRIEIFTVNVLNGYLGAEVFAGGCFFLNMLVELSGQSAAMSRHILRGFVGLARLIQRWLEEAGASGILKEDLNCRQIANFIVIALNGAAALYISSRDPLILETTAVQLRAYLNQLRRSGIQE